MSDIALRTSDHKLVRVATRFGLVRGTEWRAQRLKIALQHFTGEWFRDQNAGTDYRGAIVGKNTELARRAELRRRCLSVPGIRDVESMTFTVDSRTRKHRVHIVVVVDDGAQLEVDAEAGG